ncbi:hypothetical protein CWB99_04515 [Pseudoalteromonas rubra]|uniref:Acetylornithine aminotransferase n=2 Tax=Pseudoalteromonas rubra TaxID=43658 RepID=A0A5S3WTJ8_9GAMM|nr:hypothetical protein CWB99_04515 [Pseudoalteromonas rubra]TMP34605.1 hypothetical protein CWC00_07420 [Pseudoalteromonas rubra]
MMTVKTTSRTLQSASGATLTFDDGSTAIDLRSGGFGHGQREIVAAVKAQVEAMPLSNRVMITPVLASLVDKIAQLMPGELSVSYICNSGEESFDGALKLARGANPDRDQVVVVSGSHLGCLSYGQYFSQSGVSLDYLPLRPVFVEANDSKALASAITAQTLAVVYEPVLTQQQLLPLSEEFLMTMRTLSKSTGATMIAYEVNTGMGRCGRNFATELTSVVPDVMVIGGALNAGCVPVGGYVTHKALNDLVYGKQNPSLHGSTTGGNPASCVAALQALIALESQGVANRQTQIGAQLVSSIDGQASCKQAGSLVYVTLKNAAQADAMKLALAEAGLLVATRGHELHLTPPLMISDSELAEACATLSKIIKQVNVKEAA